MKIKQRHIYMVFTLLLCIFMVTKVIRGSADTESQGGIWNYIQIIFIIAGVYVIVCKGKILIKNITITVFVAFSLYIWFLALFSISGFSLLQLYSYIMIPYGAMVLLLFYDIGRKTDMMTYSKIFIPAFYLMAILVSYIIIRHKNLMLVQTSGFSDVYYVVSLLPLVLVYTRRGFKFAPFLVTVAALLLTGKRAGIIIVGIMFLIQYFNFSTPKISSIVRNFFSLVLLLSLIYFISDRLIEMYELRIWDRLTGIVEDGGSGRDIRYLAIINELSNSTVFHFLFGHGNGSAAEFIRIHVTGNSTGGEVHNDFLQVFYDYGFFAFLLYLSFFISLFATARKMLKKEYPYAKQFLMLTITAFFIANFSFYIIMPLYITSCSACFGFFLSDWKKFKYNKFIINSNLV